MSRLVEAILPIAQIASKRVTAVIPDATRALPLEAMLQAALKPLAAAASITVLVGLGLHRPMSEQELEPVRALCERYGATLRQHDAGDSSALVSLGGELALYPEAPERGAIPVSLHEQVVGAELLICLGVVEPHQYAGFSGGAKAFAIGCAGRDTIGAMHGLTYLRDERATLGAVNANPFRGALDRIASRLSAPLYALQYVPPGASQEPAEWLFGELSEVFERACALARARFFRPLDQRLEAVHLRVTGPKSANAYQASRAASYVALVDRPALAPGGAIVLEAKCPEGMGQGSGEIAFAEALGRGVEVLTEELRGERCAPQGALSGGVQRAYVMAKVLERHPLIWIGAAPMPALQGVGVLFYATLEHALTAHPELRGRLGSPLDDVFHAVPYLSLGKVVRK